MDSWQSGLLVALIACFSAAGLDARAGAASDRPTDFGIVLVHDTTPLGPPKGWRPAFEDGRLNPNRGYRTSSGDAQTNAIWTQKVPRRLIRSAPGALTRAAPGH